MQIVWNNAKNIFLLLCTNSMGTLGMKSNVLFDCNVFDTSSVEKNVRLLFMSSSREQRQFMNLLMKCSTVSSFLHTIHITNSWIPINSCICTSWQNRTAYCKKRWTNFSPLYHRPYVYTMWLQLEANSTVHSAVSSAVHSHSYPCFKLFLART